MGYWPLNEGSGTAATDVMTLAKGAGNTGTYSPNSAGAWTGGTLNVSPGPINRGRGGGASFNGSSGYVGLGNSSSFNFTTRYTFEAWVKIAAITGGSQWVLGKDIQGSRSYDWGIFTNTFALQINGSNLGLATTVMTADAKWHHVAAVYDGTNVTYYLDGASDGVVAGADPVVTTESLNIGRRGYTTNQDFWNGQIAHLAVYSYAVAAARIKYHYLAGFAGGLR